MKKCLTTTASTFEKEKCGTNPFFGLQKKIINWAIMHTVNSDRRKGRKSSKSKPGDYDKVKKDFNNMDN